jgi:hypothetical protein
MRSTSEAVLAARIDVLAMALREALGVLSGPQAAVCADRLRCHAESLDHLGDDADAAAAGQLAGLLNVLDATAGDAGFLIGAAFGGTVRK